MTSRFAVVVGLCAVFFGGAAGCAMGGADETGASGEELRRFCGGIAGIPCRDGFVCVDDPRDSCDPMTGGADCGGVCRRAHRTRCDYGDPSRSYVSRDPDQCAAIHFFCETGAPFFDDCGCGCEGVCLTTAFCVEGYTWDETTCSCVPTESGERCGDRVCGAGQVCCNASCGICTEPDMFCTQQACDSTPSL